MTASNARITPRWKAIFDELQAELASLTYGSDFYTIGQICQKFEVSQITAIRALNELAALNLIEKIPGRGSIVRQIARPMSFRTLQPANARHDLFTFDSPSARRMEGISAAARELGIDHGIMSEAHLTSLFPRQQSDALYGFLLLGPVSWQTRRFLKKHDIAHVMVDPLAAYRGVAHTRVDRRQAGMLAAEHLLKLGHRRIGWITGPVCMRNFRQRLAGYRSALHREGIRFDWNLVKEIEATNFTDGPERMISAQLVKGKLQELLALRRPPTAIIAGDDFRAIHILNACREMGIDVPGDLSVLGYPNNPESSLTTPALSVVDARFEEAGQAAVRLLVEQVLAKAGHAKDDKSAPASSCVMIQPRVIVRQSTGPVRANAALSHESIQAGA